jgi:hypothetical protein
MNGPTDLRVAVVTFALAVAVVGCGYVVAKSNPMGCPAALIEGVLDSRDGELVVTSADGLQQTRIEWPFGWSVRTEDNMLVVTDLLGNVKAREGDGISAGGGMISDDAFGVCGGFYVTKGLSG